MGAVSDIKIFLKDELPKNFATKTEHLTNSQEIKTSSTRLDKIE